MKLQKEVQHLKAILNLNRKGGALDVQQQLFELKEENSRLKGQAGKVAMVEQLKSENKILRIELQELRARTSSDTFTDVGFKNSLAAS